MRTPKAIAIAAVSGLAASVSGQQLIHTVDKDDFTYDLSTAPSLAVNNSIVVVAGSHELLIFDKANPVTALSSPVTYGPTLPDPSFPFVPVDDPMPIFNQWPSLIFPRADYDPYTGRIWMAYGEREPQFASSGGPERSNSCGPFFHLAVQKDLATNPQTNFSTSQWWYYTGTPATSPSGVSRYAFNLGSDDPTSGVQPFRSATPQVHVPPVSLGLPSIAYDETHLVVAVTTPIMCAVPRDGLDPATQALVIIPRNHAGGSTADGDRPAENTMVVANLQADPIVFDNSFHNLAVQEPFEQHDNIMLFISTSGGDAPSIYQDKIRLKALFYDTVDQHWELRQQLQLAPDGTLFLKDIQLPSGMHYRLDAPGFDSPDTPYFEPTVEGDFFTSAVLTKDNAGNDRVFAVHAAKPYITPDRWIVRWYVIDPKLGDIIDPNVLDTSWQPTLIASGLIETADGNVNDYGHCYHPVIGVTRTGQAFVEYTFSNDTTEQRIVRATLNSAYNGVASYSTLQVGPDYAFQADPADLDRWALYADMQADPSEAPGVCKWLWSTHTLVNEDPTPPSPFETDRRDIWLFRTIFSGFCFQTDLNQSGFTDEADMALYTDYYTAGDMRADTDANEVVDVIDMLNFVDAYDDAAAP